MEESQKRRERLKAMRMEAAQVGVHGEDGYPGDASPSLANPLLEASTTPSVHAGPNVARRFDYYTDPMSAFSANKSWSKVSHQISPGSFTPPRPRNVFTNPSNQAQATYGPDQRMFPAPQSYPSYSASGSPMGSPSTFVTPSHGNMNVGCGTFGFPSNLSRGGNFPRADFVQRGCPSIDFVQTGPRNVDTNPSNQAQATYGPDQRMFPAPESYPSYNASGSPMGSPSTFVTPPHNNMNVGCGTFGFPSNLSRGGNFPRTDFVQRGCPSIDYGESRGYGLSNNPQTGSGSWGKPYPHSGSGRSQWLGGNTPQIGYGNSGSPHHQSGRGISNWRGNNRGSMQSGRRVGSHDNVSAELRPDLYYNKSMVEDPWEMLKPIIWKKGTLTSLDTPDSGRPDLFYNKYMVEDPWEKLKPIIQKKGTLTSLDTPDSVKPWLPKSISSKKARVSETSFKYTSGKSLAEELAASFHAAANYDADDNSAKENV